MRKNENSQKIEKHRREAGESMKIGEVANQAAGEHRAPKHTVEPAALRKKYCAGIGKSRNAIARKPDRAKLRCRSCDAVGGLQSCSTTAISLQAFRACCWRSSLIKRHRVCAG